MGLVVTTMYEQTTVAEDEDELEQAQAIDSAIELGDFVRNEIPRINSILGASTSDLEHALGEIAVTWEESPADEAHRAVSDALRGCRDLAVFSRVFSRLAVLSQRRPSDDDVKTVVDNAVGMVTSDELLRGVSMVREYTTRDVKAFLDRERVSQAVIWLVKAISAAMQHAKAGSSRQLILVLKLEDSVETFKLEIAQTMGIGDEIAAFLESNAAAHWWLVGARMLLERESIGFETFDEGRYGGFRLGSADALSKPQPSPGQKR